MIDWTKPIETVDGRKARRLHESVCGGGHCVYTLPDPESCGSKHDIFLVDDNGFRCDDRAIYSKRQEPFIRNVKVKREGWIKLRCIEWCVMAETKEAIEATISPDERNEGWKAVYAEWEE